MKISGNAAIIKAMQEQVDEAVARYKGELLAIQREVAASLERFETYKATAVCRDQREGYIDSLRLNISSMAGSLVEAAAKAEAARRMRDEVAARIRFAEQEGK